MQHSAPDQRNGTLLLSRIAVVAFLLLPSCGNLKLATIADTQFLMNTRDLPFERILVVCDAPDLGFKTEVESDMSRFLSESADVEPFRDIDLYSPLKTLSEKEKLWALKDAGINAVLYIYGGGSGRSLRDWIFTEAKDVDITTQAWKLSSVRLIVPGTGEVVWVAGVPEESQVITPEIAGKRLYAAIVGDLLQRGFISENTRNQPLIRGFNR